MDFLIGSPFSTPVGQRIEQATSSSLPAEDWALNMEICDIINETDEGPKDAVRAIKKRIVGNKNFREVMLALTVLEACVKNCGHRFHVLVSTREFVEGVLVRTILPKNNPPMILHDRVLSLIQAWADAFRSSPSLTGVISVYEDLKKRGLEFPMTDLDALSPIHTPHRSVAENEPSTTPPAGPSGTRPAQNPPPMQNTGPFTITPEQVRKLRADLEVVRGNQKVMSEMLSQLTPSNAQPSDAELLQQLYTVCRGMQTRVLELISRLADEGLIEELLAVNDDLNNTFISYHRFERLSSAPHATERQPDTVSTDMIDLSLAPPTSPANQPGSKSDSSASPNQTATYTSGTEMEDEFDMFAQTRSSSLAEQRKCVRYEDPGAIEGLAGALDSRLQVTGAMPTYKTAVMDNIEKWLSEDVKDDAGESEGVTSEEFDKFLEERAKVADNLPSLPNTTSALAPPQPRPSRPDETAHDQLFTL